MKKNLWPYGIILAFVLFISGTIGLIVMASTQHEDLVSKNYYEQELRYQSRLDSLERAASSGASLVYDAVERRIVVALPVSPSHTSTSGTVQLYRPSEAGLDREITLQPGGDGRQSIDVRALQSGLWKVRVCWSADGLDYQLEGSLTNSATGVQAPHVPLK